MGKQEDLEKRVAKLEERVPGKEYLADVISKALSKDPRVVCFTSPQEQTGPMGGRSMQSFVVVRRGNSIEGCVVHVYGNKDRHIFDLAELVERARQQESTEDTLPQGIELRV